MDSRKKIYAIGLLILLLAVIPYSRNLLIAQVAQSINRNYAQLGTHSVIKPTEPKSARDVSDALVLGYRKSRGASSIDPYFQMLTRFPNEPALCANLLKYSLMYGPESIESNAHKMEEVIKTGQKLEPDNGYFDYFEAVLRFEQKRDAEALAALHRAAGKKRYNDHQAEETMALIRNSGKRWPFPLGWVNPINRIASAAAILFPQLADFRKAAVTTASYETQAARQGNTAYAAEMMADLVTIGGMMRDEGTYTIGALVGIAIQRIGVKGMYEGITNRPVDADTPASYGLSRIRIAVPDALGESEWEALSKNIARSEEFRARSKNYTNHFTSAGFMYGLVASIVWYGFAAGLLLTGLVLGLVYLIVSVILHVRGSRGAENVGPRRLSVGLLAVLPIAMGLLVLAGLSIVQMFSTFHGSSGSFPTLPIALVAILILVGIAAARTRTGSDARRADVFAARLRTGSAYAAKAFLVLYVAAMIINIPATAWAYHKLNQVALNEVQMIWQYPPAK